MAPLAAVAVSTAGVRGNLVNLLLTSKPAGTLRGFRKFLMERPVLFLLLLRVAQECWRRWTVRRCFLQDRNRIKAAHLVEEFDGQFVQGCLISAENLPSLGRVEKRTLFVRPLLEVLGNNQYLLHELLKSATMCRKRGLNCLVTRWLPPDERYHILQCCLNSVSSLFATNYVHCNALTAGEAKDMFRSTWYCLTVMMPTRQKKRSDAKEVTSNNPNQTITFTDMSRRPRATLRIVIVNESDIRRIADGKCNVPSGGFFNDRHAERYRMLCDFAKNFQLQLLRTPAGAKHIDSRNPFTSEKVSHDSAARLSRPDGGSFKRVESQPCLAGPASLLELGGKMQDRGDSGALVRMAAASGVDKSRISNSFSDAPRRKAQVSEELDTARVATDKADSGASEDNCFLRLHVPHLLSRSSMG